MGYSFFTQLGCTKETFVYKQSKYNIILLNNQFIQFKFTIAFFNNQERDLTLSGS